MVWLTGVTFSSGVFMCRGQRGGDGGGGSWGRIVKGVLRVTGNSLTLSK